jgi:4-alpha-glucanotransferase
MDKKQEMLRYIGFNDENWDKCYDDIIRTVLSSHADTVILPIQDILHYGKDTRLNVPGKAKGNWSYRLTKEQLASVDCSKYRELNARYGR